MTDSPKNGLKGFKQTVNLDGAPEWMKTLMTKGEANVPVHPWIPSLSPSLLQPPIPSPHKGRQASIEAANAIGLKINMPSWLTGIAYQINEERRNQRLAASTDIHELLGSTKWWAHERKVLIACLIDQTENPPPNIRAKGTRIERHLRWMK